MSETALLHDRYRIQRKLGSGAFGTVYLAEDLKMGRPVAVKVVEDARDLDGRALREARAAAKLSHPNIVHVYEVLREPKRTLLFGEYVEGCTLRELYNKRRLSEREILQAGIQICRALEHAHKKGVVHRDIKPENVMLADGEGVEVRVMDFGVAQLEDLTSITLDGDLVGTLAYMAPEQLQGRNVDAKADVYALAVTLYEGFTGRNPLRGAEGAGLVRDPSRLTLPRLGRERPDLPASLESALHEASHPEPDERLDAAGLRHGLETALRELPEAPVREPFEERARRFLRSGRRLERLAYVGRHLTAGALALVMLGSLLPRMPFYPPGLVFPLTVAGAFVSLLAPGWGGLLALILLAPPVFAFSVGWGVLYLAATLPLFLFLRRRGLSWAALLPATAPVLGPLGLGLTLPPLTGALLRGWGPLVGLLSGLTLALAAGLQGWERLPYVYSPGLGAPLLESRHTVSPGAALQEAARFLDARPELLLQAVLFAVFAVPLGRLLRGGEERRFWVASLYLAALFAAFGLLPSLVLGVLPDLVRLVLAYLPCVIIVFLYTLLASPEGSRVDLEG